MGYLKALRATNTVHFYIPLIHNFDIKGCQNRGNNKRLQKYYSILLLDYRAATYREGCYCGVSFGQGPLPKGRCYAYCPGAQAEDCVGKYTHSVWFTGQEEGKTNIQ